MKKVLIIIGIVAIVLFALAVAKDQIIKSAITVVASQVTGAPVHIEVFSLGVFSQSVRITNFRMYNPEGFPKGILVDIPKIWVVYDLGALFKKKIHLANAQIELKEIGITRNKEGKLNADSLKMSKQEGQAKPTEQMPFAIDLLKLNIGKVIYKDYSGGKEPSVMVYDINIHKTYKNITGAGQLAALILAEPMKAAGIRGAKIYGVAMLAGAAVLPVAVASTFAEKDSVQQDFAATFEQVYAAGLEVLKKMGKVTMQDRTKGVIGANIDSAKISLKLSRAADRKINVTVSARKYLLPKPEIAGGVLYEMAEKLK